MGYYSDDYTDKELNKLEKKIAGVYREAYAEMKRSADTYFSTLQDRYDKEYDAYQNGAYTQEEFNLWYKTQVKRGEGYQKMADDLASRATNANMVASSYINDKTPSIYSLNYSYETYEIQQGSGVSYHAYDEQTIKNLLMDTENVTEFRTTRVNPERDYEWNKELIDKALTSSILQGKSIDKLSDAFLGVMKRNKASAVRNARTSFTSAQNAGRQMGYNQAKEMGLDFDKEWIATLDERTRISHGLLDGKRVPCDKTFSNGLMYPADSSGAPAEVYNCRCTMRAIFKNVNDANRQTYTEWKAEQSENTDILDIKAEVKEASRFKPDYNCNIAQKCGRDFYEEMSKRLSECDNEALVKLWSKDESKIDVGSTTKKGAYCMGRSIYLDIKTDAQGNSYETPYSVVFHESGHAIDKMHMKDGSKLYTTAYYSTNYKDGIFPNTIKKEIDNLVGEYDTKLKAEFKEHKNDVEWLYKNSYITKFGYEYYKQNGEWYASKPSYSKSRAYKALEREVCRLDPRHMSDLSDMLEGATKGKISCGYGHGKSYWNDAGKLGTEAFAEMTSASLANAESLEVIKKYLPESYNVYCEMIEHIANKEET